MGRDGPARRRRSGSPGGVAGRRLPAAHPDGRRRVGGDGIHRHRGPTPDVSPPRPVAAARRVAGARPVSRAGRAGGVMTAAERIDRACAECARIASTHYENWPIGAFLLPRHLRSDLAAVCAFARGGDDLADEGDSSGRLERLATYEAKLLACAGDPESVDEPVFLALGHTLEAHALPVQPFRDLITAFRRDAAGETQTMATFADVLEYCRCSANPVGRIVLGLFGHRDPERQAHSDEICTRSEERR